MKTAEKLFKENLSGLQDVILDDELFQFYKDVIIRMLDAQINKRHSLGFRIVSTDEIESLRIPSYTLIGESAEKFIKQADLNAKRKGSIDFSKEYKIMKKIIKKSKKK